MPSFQPTRCQKFRSQLLCGSPVTGTFVKTPSPIVCEVLALTRLDAVCLDAEHAPFGRLELDGCIAMLRANDMPSLVRVPSADPAHILNALDCGATGIIVPHVKTADEARQVAAAARFGDGGRGYAGSTRAACYTRGKMPDNLRANREETVVIIQVEDLDGVAAIDEIVAVDGIDCVFVGRIDLTVALAAGSPDDAPVVAAVEQICSSCRRAERPVGMFVPRLDELPKWRKAGASLFLLSSDHSFLLNGADKLVDDVAGLV